MPITATIQLGSVGPDVERWQRIIGVEPDGDFGPMTEATTRAWQQAHGLPASGIVDAPTWAAAAERRRPDFPFIAARNFTKARNGVAISVVVIHTMEALEKPGTARKVANWFAGNDAPEASAHYCIDDAEIIQCVREEDTAWAAPGANSTGIHLEHAGFAAQTAADWADAYSVSMLKRSATFVADICARRGIPIKKLTPADLIAGAPGICGHVDVSNAFHKSDHTDPGGAFPWDRYLEWVVGANPSIPDAVV
jgi:N-acetyl-anhydromuramyl-L-alanine amidase AmpD